MMEQRKQRALGQTRTVHMVGIGGIGMSSIAEVLLLRGYAVTGSDLEESAITRRLESLGAGIRYDHAAAHVGNADVVAYSSAVRPELNPETLEAERRRIPLIRRDEMLGELMRMKYGVAIAGTHGKTTTTSLVGLVAHGGGCEPTVIVGGRVAEFGSNAITGEGDLIVIEADEYDRTFLRLTPIHAVITNIEEEHLDTYRDFEDIKSAFVQFANSVPFFGSVIVCLDDPTIRECLHQIDRPVLTYGLSRQASVRGEDVHHKGLRVSFGVAHDGNHLGRMPLWPLALN
jgi:UDP-N-acetylmuramate--alanine ligase